MSIRRLAVLCTAMLCAGMLVLCRVFWIAADQSYAASAAAQTVSETVLPIRRGNFYDRIGRPLTGVTPRWYALCIPGDSSYLHEIAEIHNTDTVTDVFHNAQVMCNKNIGQIQVMLQFI